MTFHKILKFTASATKLDRTATATACKNANDEHVSRMDSICRHDQHIPELCRIFPYKPEITQRSSRPVTDTINSKLHLNYNGN